MELAVARTHELLVGSVLLLGAAVAATALADLAPSPIAVAVIAAVVGGEQLRYRWRTIPTHVPAPIDASPDVATFRERVVGTLIVALVFAACVVGGALLDSGAVLLGFPGGLVIRDAVMMIRVRRWQARHRRTLVWLDDGVDLEPRVLGGDSSSSARAVP